MTLLLVTMAHPHFAEYEGAEHLGRLVVPDHYWRVRDTAAAGIPWACDNGCFHALDPQAWARMLGNVRGLEGCRFVAVPDVVADAAATLERFEARVAEVEWTGQPPALVAQDGLEPSMVPWNRIGALFIGGSTAWKLGAAARVLVGEALRRGLWVHMGRVNGRRRYDYARALGCHSSDGSGLGRYHRAHLADALSWSAQQLVPGLVLTS